MWGFFLSINLIIFPPMILYENYQNSKTGDTQTKINVLVDIINEHPKIIDYIYNRVDTCFGPHIVYLIEVKIGQTSMLKIGYTKNSVEGRFAEKRYSGRDAIEIVEIIRQHTLQAFGAVQFESALKEICKPYQVSTQLTLPGKNEFMNIDHKQTIIQLYDSLFPQFQNVVGLKSPN